MATQVEIGYDQWKIDAIVKGTDEHLAALKAATDPLAWLLLMDDSETRVACALGVIPERRPYLDAANEIKRLREIVEEKARG